MRQIFILFVAGTAMIYLLGQSIAQAQSDAPLSPVERQLKAALSNVEKNNFNGAISEFQQALKLAKTSCEKGWALSGLSAAYAGKASIEGLPAGHPHAGQLAGTLFWKQYQDLQMELGKYDPSCNI
ncbi:hypothetical protein K9N68_03245 [Kovacikia minuta CCNUW1]|uniref:hypothetical protein n=1 Tax=Kovacikia minuta TaxID=2931930 RepID=UPI001CCD787B|nr:hypothetical protein [Kovacikia minuta]UBF27010.1 hypothetical protein K9N68_03245 [Kovacikia minuta CCNUW1]